MSRAVICPVCGGCGEYSPAKDKGSTGGPPKRSCHGCGGRGWVEVGCSEPPIKPRPTVPPRDIVKRPFPSPWKRPDITESTGRPLWGPWADKMASI